MATTDLENEVKNIFLKNLPFMPNTPLNWTELANRYGVTGGNRGQTVKEYLANRGVPAAQIKQRNLVCRAKLKLPGGEIGFPTHLTISAQKTELQIKIESGIY